MQKGSVLPLNKRIFSMMLVLVMAALGFSALAEAVPSVTIDSIVNVSSVVSSTGVALPESFEIAVNPQSAAAAAVIEEIATVAQTQPVAVYFGETAMAAISEKLPESVTTDTLKLSELTAISVADYNSSYGDITLTITTATEYDDDTVVVVLVGMWVDGELIWMPMDAVVVDGQVCVVFTQDVLADGNSELLFALLTAE